MDIDLTGKTISFPKVCSCCGDPTTATRVIGHTRRSGRVAHLARWTVPACPRCEQHAQAAIWGGPVAVLLFFVALLSLGLLSPLLWLWRRHKRASATALCGPSCGSYDGMTYAPMAVPGGPGHRFLGANREFVRQLALTNRAALHEPSPELRALIE